MLSTAHFIYIFQFQFKNFISSRIHIAVGIGFGWSSFFISMTSYFDVHRNKASGMSMTLAAIGPIFYPPIITILLKYYGVDGCIWILGAISLNIFAAALLLQPVSRHMKRVQIKDPELMPLHNETDLPAKIGPSRCKSGTKKKTNLKIVALSTIGISLKNSSIASNVDSRR